MKSCWGEGHPCVECKHCRAWRPLVYRRLVYFRDFRGEPDAIRKFTWNFWRKVYICELGTRLTDGCVDPVTGKVDRFVLCSEVRKSRKCCGVSGGPNDKYHFESK